MLVQSALLAIAAVGASATPAHSLGANLKARVASEAVVGASAHTEAHIKARQEEDPIVPDDESYVATTAPVDNIFRGITYEESNDIWEWFESHGNSSAFPNDFTFYATPWLLAPNKTEALEYLEGNGTKPLRYARIMGSGDCEETEYMFGPLPITEDSKASPLAYANHGNPTVETCTFDDDDEDFEDRRRKRSERHERFKAKRSMQRRSPHNPYEVEMEWNGAKLAHDEKVAPVAILPDGARHEFDPEQNYVSWMDFSFFVSDGPGGVSLHDIKWQGKRIMYELAMQEALAHYAGPDESQSTASYLDVTLGFTSYNLIPGIDCPTYATYTDAFCLFEHPMDFPMARHNAYSWYHGVRNVAFIVRSVSTVGNYDYMTSYEFHYDGTIQVSVRASGYIQGSDSVNTTNIFDYGFKIRDYLSGSMHDHVLNFKADVDILGTKNTLFKSEFVPHTEEYSWSNGLYNTMRLARSFITNEDDGKINWSPNAAAAYSVVNKDEPNEFGEYPGFKIAPSLGSVTHLTVQDSTMFGKLVDWASHHLYVLRRKDSEPVSAHPNANGWGPTSLTDFNAFFDGENIEQEDLVLYFNLGMHHAPDLYDLPVTVFQGAQSGVSFRPQNYGRTNAIQRTRQQVRVDGEVSTYGVNQPEGDYDLSNTLPQEYPEYL